MRPFSDRTLRRRALLLALAVALATPVVSSSAANGQNPAGHNPADRSPAGGAPPGTYVAIGDSFTAGPLIPGQTLEDLGCLRSNRNYPSLVSSGGLALRDVSCSAARIRHVTETQTLRIGSNPPQAQAIDLRTRLVTIGLGGNDIGFGNLVEECVVRFPWSTPCKTRYTRGGTDRISARIAQAGRDLDAALEHVVARAPAAEIHLVGYAALLPHSGSGCWPRMAMTGTDVHWLRRRFEELNAMLRSRADAHGIGFIDLYSPSRGHDACQSAAQRWVEPLIPASQAAPLHPNATGMRAIAAVVSAALGHGW